MRAAGLRHLSSPHPTAPHPSIFGRSARNATPTPQPVLLVLFPRERWAGDSAGVREERGGGGSKKKRGGKLLLSSMDTGRRRPSRGESRGVQPLRGHSGAEQDAAGAALRAGGLPHPCPSSPLLSSPRLGSASGLPLNAPLGAPSPNTSLTRQGEALSLESRIAAEPRAGQRAGAAVGAPRLLPRE